MSNQSTTTASTTGQVTTSPQMSQGDAVVQAIRDVLKSDYKEGAKVVLSDDHRKAVSELLVKGFTEGRIALKPTPTNEAKLKDAKLLQGYVKGLINNWLTKSPLLNGKPAKAKAPAPAASAPTPTAVTSMPPAPEAKPVEIAAAKSETNVQEAVKAGKDPVAAVIGSKKPILPAGKK
jgi:hypothetical protein